MTSLHLNLSVFVTNAFFPVNAQSMFRMSTVWNAVCISFYTTYNIEVYINIPLSYK